MNHFETSKETTRIAPEYRQYRKVEKTFKDKRFGFAENQLLEVPLIFWCARKHIDLDLDHSMFLTSALAVWESFIAQGRK